MIDSRPPEAKSQADGGSLLGRFGGEPPPPAQWFADAIAIEPERSFFECEGVDIELLTWGERGAPGLLFLHGSGAQADWWSAIAPFFAKDYRVAAISLSGMGRSGWRESYSVEQWACEALGAITAAGLADATPPVVVGHSLGGSPLVHLGAEHPDRLAAGVLVDSFVLMAKRQRPVVRTGPLPRYPSQAEALARYRLRPEQPTDWPEIVDYIARHSMHRLTADDKGPSGWSWRFDPQHMASVDWSVLEGLADRVQVPMALIIGEKSALIDAGQLDEIRAAMPAYRMGFAIPEAQHHIMIDQPLALVAGLRATLSVIAQN